MSDSGLLSTVELARLLHVEPYVVRKWRYRELLPVAGLDARGRPLYRQQDGARCEAATRARAHRTPHVLPT